ncbi:MAG: hypothetical protein K2H09_09710, partial [Treponemataceae bacterium]|nr:hypothetical protein [Treponemataceae bacterium]
ESAEFSDFMLDELTMDFVQARTLTVSNLAKLDSVKREMNFQWSSMISDEEAQKLGTAVGANVIIYGSIKKIGANLNLVVQALNVPNAILVDMCRFSVEPNSTTEQLLSSSEKTSAASKPAKYEAKEPAGQQAATLSPCTSDLQLRLFGYHGIFYKASPHTSSYSYRNNDSTYECSEWCMSLANYNLFNINKVVSVGFFEEISANIWLLGFFGVGFNFVTGPAIGITVGKVVTFQIAPGLSLGFDYFSSYLDEGITTIPVGFNGSLVMKFLPTSVVSPIIGCHYDMKSGSITDGSATTFHSLNATMGLSFNFGRQR